MATEDRPVLVNSAEEAPESGALQCSELKRTRSGIWASVKPDLSDSPRLASFFEYWSSKRRGDSIPDRAAINPVELKAHLGDLLIVEPIDDSADFRYRLVGTNVTAVNGRDYTGWTVRQVFASSGDDEAEKAVRAYQLVANRHLPVRVSGGVLWARKEYITFESILLPIWSPERKGTWVVAKLIFLGTGRAGQDLDQ